MPNELLNAAKNGDLILVCELLNKGFDIEAVNQNYWSALHFAAFFERQNICVALLNHGANTEVKDLAGRTPLHLAAEKGHTDICIELINHGANIEARENGKTSLHFAAADYDIDVCLVLIANSGNPEGITSKDKKIREILKMSPLEAAASFGSGSLIMKILDTDLDQKTLPERVKKQLI